MSQFDSKIKNQIRDYLPTGHMALLLSFFVVAAFTIWRINYKILDSTDPYIFRDFLHAYYPAGRLIIEEPAKLYEFSKTIDGLPQPVIYGFVNLPIIAYVFTPFSFLTGNVANIIYLLLGVASIIWATWLLIRHLKLSSFAQAIFICIVGINAPIFNSIWLGNSTHIIFLAVIASFLCFRAKKDFWSGALLAIAGLIKIPLFFPIVYFLLKKRWYAALGFCSTVISVVCLSILVCGLPINITWFQKCILSFSDKTAAGDTLQSVDSFLIRLLTNTPIDSFDPVGVDWRFKLIRYSLFLVLIGSTIFIVFRSRNIDSPEINNLEFCAFLTLALVISPISWTHYYLLLLLPIALYLGGKLAIPKQWCWTVAMGLSILLVITPNVRSSPLNHPLVNALTRHFLVSHYFWGGILMLGLLLIALQQQLSHQRKPRHRACLED